MISMSTFATNGGETTSPPDVEARAKFWGESCVEISGPDGECIARQCTQYIFWIRIGNNTYGC